MLKDSQNDFSVNPSGYDNRGGGLHPPSPNESQEHFSNSTYEEAIHRELEEREYYIEKNVFWVPALARWKTLQDCMRECAPAKCEAFPQSVRAAEDTPSSSRRGTVIEVKGAQASRLSIQDGKASGSDKDTGKMPMLS